MKAFGKILAIAAVVFALVFALAACRNDEEVQGIVADTSSTDDTVTTEDPPPAPPATENDDEGTTPPVEELPTFAGLHAPRDLGGRTLLVASGWGQAMPFSRIQYDEPDPATDANYLENRLIFNNTQRVLSEFNFVMDYVHVTDNFMGVVTSSILAGDPVGDTIFLGGSEVLSAIIGDLILPLSVIDLPGADIFNEQRYAAINVYEFGEPWVWYYQMVSPHIWFMAVNLDLVNAIGAPNPVDLYYSGQWTWANALEIMRMATRDTTGDGILDQWGLAGQPADLVRHFMASNDAPWVDENLNYALDHPNTIETLEFLETIFRENLWQFDPVGGADPGDWGANFFAGHQGQAVMWPGILWGMGGGDLPFEFAVVPFPTGPSNYSGSTWSVGWGGGLSIPHGTSWNPADILMVSEEFLTWHRGEDYIQANLGLGWARGTFLTEEDVQRWARIDGQSRTDLGLVVPEYYWIGGAFVGNFLSQEMTILQAIEAFRPEQQELLDNFFGDFDGFR